MSDVKNNVQKTVKISEKNLVELIESIVTEAVSIKKKEWLSEQAAKGNQTAILEEKLQALTEKVNRLTERQGK